MFTKTALDSRLHEKQMFETEFKAFIKDQSIPLDERWDLFKFACENNLFVNISPWIYHSKILESNSNFYWYDDFGIEKYEIVKFVRIIEITEEHLTEIEKDKDPEIYWEGIYPITTNEKLNSLKEEILATGYSGFEMDW